MVQAGIAFVSDHSSCWIVYRIVLITQINGMVFTSYSFFMKMQICLAGAGSGLASSYVSLIV